MYFQTIALLSLSLFGTSSGKIHDVVTDFEDVPTCGAKKKKYCNKGPFFNKIKKTLVDAPVVEGFYVDADDTAAAQGAINELIFYFQKKCKNCVEEEAKDELCALKDPIYQGIFDWVSDTMKDTVATYCPPEDFVCGKKHYEHCNGDLLSKMSTYLESTPKNGGVAAPEALNELNGFFTHVCKSCVDHGNAKALCASTKTIVAGIINNDDREYEDPTAKFCGELYETVGIPGGTLYHNKCVPGYNDWGKKKGLTEIECYQFCKDTPECMTADYLGSDCYPSKAGIDKSKPYNNCDMWVKDGGVPGGSLHHNTCVPGYNSWGKKTGLTKIECYQFCKDTPECMTADYLGSDCYPSKAGIAKSKPYNNCDMWVKDGGSVLTPMV